MSWSQPKQSAGLDANACAVLSSGSSSVPFLYVTCLFSVELQLRGLTLFWVPLQAPHPVLKAILMASPAHTRCADRSGRRRLHLPFLGIQVPSEWLVIVGIFPATRKPSCAAVLTKCDHLDRLPGTASQPCDVRAAAFGVHTTGWGAGRSSKPRGR